MRDCKQIDGIILPQPLNIFELVLSLAKKKKRKKSNSVLGRSGNNSVWPATLHSLVPSHNRYYFWHLNGQLGFPCLTAFRNPVLGSVFGILSLFIWKKETLGKVHLFLTALSLKMYVLFSFTFILGGSSHMAPSLCKQSQESMTFH